MSANDGAASSSNVTAEELIKTMDSVPSANDEAASSSNDDIITDSDQDAIMKKEAEDSVPRANDETASINNGDIITDPDQEAAVEVQQLSGPTRRDTTNAAWMSSSYEREETSHKQVGQHPHTQGGYMDPQLYDAAVKGNIEPFDTVREIDSIVTPNKNTILHINIMSQNRSSLETTSTNFVKDILARCPSLLFKVNVNDETPLHVAAKYGHSDMVEVLINAIKDQNEDLERGIEDAKHMLRRINNEGNTALHEAVKYEHLNVLKILTKEDPDFTYASNNRGETPLYIAAKKSSYLVDEILQTCTSPAYDGPNQMTALHAAAIHCHLGTTRKILKKKESLKKEKDQYGWTPLHYSAYYHNFESMEALLECDVSTAYIGDEHRKMTPLHIAISQGYIPEEIISRCPNCCELVDERRWNVLHFAMLSLTTEDLKNLLKYPLIRNLIHDKDVDGNTPLHLLATFRSHLLPKIKDMVGDIKLDLGVVNKQFMSVHEMMIKSGSSRLKQEILKLKEPAGPYLDGIVRIRCNWKEVKKRRYERRKKFIEKVKESHLIVAALIATVTFTAAFTLPGGVIQDEGSAILSKKAAFQAFVITDAIAMVLSLSAVFAHFLVGLAPEGIRTEASLSLLGYGALSTVMAMGAMVIAFVTGTYAVLTTSLWLAILTTFIGLTFFLLMFLIFKGLWRWAKIDALSFSFC